MVTAATKQDGVAPLSEHAMLHLRYSGRPAPAGDRTGLRPNETGPNETGPDEPGADEPGADEPGADAWPVDGFDLIAVTAGRVTGYAHVELEEPGVASAELVVDPASRRHGIGRALVAALAGRAGDRALRVWAHGDLPAAAALAQATGLKRVRALWQMSRPLRDPLPEPSIPADVRLRSFVRGRDEDEWLRLNARAFAHHPEQGAWTRSDLDLREQEDWFDPAGFFLAERGGRLVGFHWTKVHNGALGEVYVIGVDPAEQGTGVGRALTLTGLRYLRDDRGLAEVMLYVDDTNRAAVRMYESLGFTRTAADVMYGTG